MAVTIKTAFKQATVKGGVAVLQFEILTDSPDAFELIRMSGQTVFIKAMPEQETLAFENVTGEVIR